MMFKHWLLPAQQKRLNFKSKYYISHLKETITKSKNIRNALLTKIIIFEEFCKSTQQNLIKLVRGNFTNYILSI